jgi:hypothetical protein
MNGVRPKIEIFKPFGEAFELTNKILFQPFDLKKWLVIGFAAFLSGNLAGVGFNFPSPFGNFQSHRATQDLIPDHLEQWKPWLVAAVIVLAVLFFAFVIALTWLKARGHFIFTDCIVRNQAAIAGPWREYRKEGNGYFLFLLAIMFAILLLAGLILASAFGVGLLKQGAGETGSIASIGLIVFLFVFWVSIVIFVSMASYFMVPVMYRRRCRAAEAFRDVTFLMFHHVGSFFLFCLFGVVLILAVLMIGAIVTCATCWRRFRTLGQLYSCQYLCACTPSHSCSFASSVRITMCGRALCRPSLCRFYQVRRLRRLRLDRTCRPSHHRLQACERGGQTQNSRIEKRFDHAIRVS